MTNVDQNRQKLIALRKMLVKHFDLEEMRVLCFDLGVDYEELAGKTKTTKMQDLIGYVERRGELQLLTDTASSHRPNIAWHNFMPANKESEGLEEPIGDIYTDSKTGLEMIRIPAGEFIYGYDDRLSYLPDEYWIAKTPVTNAHYVRFVMAEGYDPPEHWEGKAPPATIANHPVVYVSWHDAKAYADWARMDLPSEEEWEKAARGTDGRQYPWGNEWKEDHCNTRETDINDTSPVGQFSPQGDSPNGCVDMSGNAWEWTEISFLRGGSWSNYQVSACAAHRDGSYPADRNFSFGFRVVVRRSSQET